MSFGGFYGMGCQPSYYNPTGAAPDALNQYKAQYQQPPQGPQFPPPAAPQQNNSGLLWVQGEAGAKSFLVAPGQSALLMDSEAMRFYIKSTDMSGMPLPLRVFSYKEEGGGQTVKPEPPASGPNMDRYVTWEGLEERLSRLAEAKSHTVKEETEDE